MTQPTLRQLEYLVAVADCGSFGEASRRCGVTQPGLSAQIQQLEHLLDLQLLERVRPKVVPTEAGRALIERARRILIEAEDLVSTARTLGRPLCGSLRLGVIPTVAPYLLPHTLPAVRREHPELRLFIREEETAVLLDLLASAEIDLLLLALDAPLGRVERLPLFEDPFLLAAPTGHPLARRKLLRESELASLPLLLLEDGHCLRDQVLDVCRHAGQAPPAYGDFRASSLGTLIQMVAGGLGITLLPSLAAGVGTEDLALVPFRSPAPARTIGLAWRPGSSRRAEFELLAELLGTPPHGSTHARRGRHSARGDRSQRSRPR